MSRAVFDVAVVGAGVVGAAIAARLARYDLQVALLDAANDVGSGTSKANTAILHTGFDAKPGSLESRLLTRSYSLLNEYAREKGIAVEHTGAILVAWNPEELAQLPEIVEKARKNGVTDLMPLRPEEIQALEPHLGKGVLGGYLIPGESIICPFSPPLAFAQEAVLLGARLYLNHKLIQSRPVESDCHELEFENGNRLVSKWVINAAGLRSDEVDRIYGHARFSVTARRGQLIVFDKLSRHLLSRILLPIPTATTKGVLVSPTVFGNLLLGPTAENLPAKDQSETTMEGLESLMEKGRRLLPALASEQVTSTYSGLRAATENSDYQIHLDSKQRYLCVGGIRSTGLSASLGIAEYAENLLREAGLRMAPVSMAGKVDFKMPPLGQYQVRPSQDPKRIGVNSSYGKMVCHCEQVSEGEIQDALASPVPARTLEGLRRRTRCLQGRCQGFYCQAKVTRLFEQAQAGVPV